jgi:hypothetical protein
MKNFKKILLVTASTIAISASAIASNVSSTETPVVSDLKVKLNGFAHFQAAHRTQSKLKGSEKNVSSNRRTFAFYNDAAMVAEVSNEANEMTYGAKIVLVPTAKRKNSPTYNGSHIFLKSDFGKIEVGSPIPSSANMIIDEGTIYAGSGNWDNYAKTALSDIVQNSKATPSFATCSDFFLDSKLATSLDSKKYSAEPSRSISFTAKSWILLTYKKN